MKSAKEYWKDRFGEYPQNDADRLAVTMMMEYYHDITKDEVVKNNLVKPDVSKSLLAAGKLALSARLVTTATSKNISQRIEKMESDLDAYDNEIVAASNVC